MMPVDDPPLGRVPIQPLPARLAPGLEIPKQEEGELHAVVGSGEGEMGVGEIDVVFVKLAASAEGVTVFGKGGPTALQRRPPEPLQAFGTDDASPLTGLVQEPVQMGNAHHMMFTGGGLLQYEQIEYRRPLVHHAGRVKLGNAQFPFNALLPVESHASPPCGEISVPVHVVEQIDGVGGIGRLEPFHSVSGDQFARGQLAQVKVVRPVMGQLAGIGGHIGRLFSPPQPVVLFLLRGFRVDHRRYQGPFQAEVVRRSDIDNAPFTTQFARCGLVVAHA